MAKGLDIHSLMKPIQSKPKDRSVWGLPLNGLWIPFFTATNAVGESNIPHDSLGQPITLVVDKDTGVPKLKETKDPLTGVVTHTARYQVDKAISKAVTGVKDNIAFGLMAFTATIQKTHPAEYKAQVEASQKAGEKVREHEEVTLGAYLAELESQAKEQEAKMAAAVLAAATAIASAPAPSEPIMETRELVPA